MRKSKFYHFARLSVLVLLRLLYRLRRYGVQNQLPGPAILAPNHASHLDPCVVGVTHSERIHFLARETLFKGKLLRWMLPRLNTHPLSRGESDLGSMRLVLQLLKEGSKVVIFPEGTRTRSGQLQEGRPGVAALALRAGVPVVPIYIDGSYELWGAERKRPRLAGRLAIFYGKALHPQAYAHLKRREAQEMLTQDLMQAIGALKDKQVEKSAAKMIRTSTGVSSD